MIRNLQVKNIGGRPVTGLFQGGSLVCEVKSASVFAADVNNTALLETRALDLATRTVTGISSILGVKDDARDILENGAFNKTIEERVNKAKKVRFLWNHDQGQPPVAVIKSMNVLGRDQLPEAVLKDFPEATGGVEVTRSYHDFPNADAVFKNLVADGLNEMSFGFIPIKYQFIKESDDQPMYLQTRRVQELKMFEVSDVQWGMNPATIAVRSAEERLLDWKAFVDELKASKDITAEHKSALREAYDLMRTWFEDGGAETQEAKGAETSDMDDHTRKALAEHSLLLAKANNLFLSME